MSTDSTLASTLSRGDRASLAARLRRNRGGELARIPARGPDVTELPLSFGQEQLWFIDQFASGSTAYNLAASLHLSGTLNVAAMSSAVTRVVAQHEALRTRMVSSAGKPLQVIDAPTPVILEPLIVRGETDAEREATLAEIERTETATPFDLARGPLFRVRLFRMSATEHVLLIGVHHAIFDGWSFGVLVEDLATWYEAEVSGTDVVPPEPAPVQFPDYALWERARLEGDVLARAVDYWRNALAGVATVPLPTDHPRPALQSAEGGLARSSFPPDLLVALRELARSQGTTLFVVMLAAVQVLLQRYSGQDDIPVGTASANRTRPELARTMGYLVNTLVIRGDLSEDPSFVELVQRVQAQLVAAYAHQDLPFAKLVEALRVPRDASRSPLFQTGFTLGEDTPATTTAGLTIRPRGAEILPAKFDLNFCAQVNRDELIVDLSYAAALFEPKTADQLLRGLGALLAGIVADPTRRLSQLPVMTEQERQREIVGWNETSVNYPVSCIDERFEQQVLAHPEAIAAEFGDESWTYRRLNAESNRVARRLRELGVGPEVLVGVAMPPSLRRLAGILGILKAGGGYVPLDPDLPEGRLTYMADDADLRVILSDLAGKSALAVTAASFICLDSEWPSIAVLDDTNLERSATPANVAYVIYTSGSTGRPKGVVVEHQQVVNFAIGMIERWPLGVGDKVLQFASLNFDVSAMDMFLAVLSGATAVFGSRQTLLSPPRLAELMRRHHVSFGCLPPAVVNLLTGERLPDLKVLISAGEALSSELVRGWLRPGLTFCNGYGPTEAAIGATLMVLDGSTFPPPIGRPMPNYRAYVLDRHLNPVPVGVVGELHIGGAGVTRGYLNQPELTAARFVPDPFAGGAQRMYKTGDLVRRMTDGNIQFVGRLDGQVKIRGLRVELGEIESVLAAQPNVAQAVVVVRDDAAGEKQLIGYIRTEQGVSISVAEVRQQAATSLPAYMVPAHLVLVEAFTLTPNGKIDQSALPAPDRSLDLDSYRAPRTLLEALLVDFYATLLRNDRVGVDDSFFDLGGNSLQAMRLITQLRDELAVDTDVSIVFLAPTPSQLTTRLREEFGIEDEDLDDVELFEMDLAAADELERGIDHAVGG